MKKCRFFPHLILTLSVLSISFFSFTTNRGGDVFEIYLNGKQVHRQFVLIDKSVKTLQLDAFNANDKIEVSYLHCGRPGTNRALTLRNEKNELIKELKYPDTENNRSMMCFYCRDIAKKINAVLKLYYASKELPDGRLLATIRLNERSVIAKL